MSNLLEDHYEKVVKPTWNNAKRCKNEQDHVMNAVLGLAGEVGEVVDIHKKDYFHKVKDRREDLKLELGDVCYYLSKVMDLHGFTLEEVLEANKEKLFERYGIDAK